MEKFIMAAGCALRISDSGERACGQSAKVLMLLHGYMESIEVWEELMPLLTPHFRVVAMDIPGHGISEVKGDIHTMEFVADVAHDVLDQLGIGQCVLVGHSMGGYAALEFVRKYPDRLQGLVMLHSTPNADSDIKRENRQREIDLILAGKKDSIAQIAPAAGFAADNRVKFAEAISHLSDQITLTEDEGIIALLRGMSQRVDMNDMLADCQVPQLFIFGRKDDYIPSDVAQKVIERQPQAKVVWLEQSGHMGLIEEPEECARAIVTEFA